MKLSSILAASLLAITAASAADLPRRSAVPANVMAPAPISNWSGFYAGAHLGYGIANVSDNYNTSAKGHGLFGGLQLGYDYQFGSIVAGLVGDISLSNVRGSSVGLGSAVQKYVGSLDARIGFLATRDLLIYGKGGYSFASTKFTFDPFVWNTTKTLSGFNLGLGAEYMIAKGTSVFAEYRYTQYQTGNTTQFVGLVPVPWNLKADTNDIRVGVNYKF